MQPPIQPRTRAGRRATAVASSVLLLAVALGACGEQDDAPTGSATEPTTDPTTEPTTEPTKPPPTEPTAGTTTPPSEGLEKVRVVGEVVQVGDCVVVRDDNAITWTITGPPAADLVAGDRVAVTGAPDLVATGCGGPVVEASVVRVEG
ncbi:hypothetical protein SFC79_06030 [Nocardioides sp. S-58]|uniref:DUF5666 domain-containing protein n=1 Tax=Nocardioides renjunii TaxID=3095075 RepID=A0ABU5K8M7_9ACTN|nr:hypothetical protein [Nocardioides sp. S-58]MDZ5661320.1 hypothetical protein [Nocardioides sp. S-58]